MSNRNIQKNSNKGTSGKEQSQRVVTLKTSAANLSRQNEEKKSQPASNDGWATMFSKPVPQAKQSDKDANQKQQNKKPDDKKNTQSSLQMQKAQSQMYANMDDAIESVEESQIPEMKKVQSEIQNNLQSKKDQNKDLIFAGFGGNGGAQKRGGFERKKPQRELTKTSWVDKSGNQETLGDLENQGHFDQFANRNTTYSESLYNTSYDVKKFSKQQVQYAARIEREINTADSNGNTHVAEERNQIQLRDNDNEEIKYSGVLRAPKLKNAKKFSGFKNKKTKLQGNFAKAFSGIHQKQETAILNPVKWDELRDKYQTKPAAPEPEWNTAFGKPIIQQNQNHYYQKQPHQNQYQNKPNYHNNNYQSQGGYQNNQDYQGGNSYHNQNYKPRYQNQNNNYNQGHQQNNYIPHQPQQVYQPNHQNSYHLQQTHQNFIPKPQYSAPPYNPQGMVAPQLGGTSHQKPMGDQRAPQQFDQSYGPPQMSQGTQPPSMNIATSSFTPKMAQNSAPWKPPSAATPTGTGLSMSTNAPSFQLSAGAQAFTPRMNK